MDGHITETEHFTVQTRPDNMALREKMAAEQAQYRVELLQQTPEDILNHASKYAMREDIIAAVDLLDIPPRQMEVLLAEPTLLDNICKLFSETEIGYMDMLRDAVELWSRETFLIRHPLEAYPLLYPDAGKVSVLDGQQEKRPSVLDALQDKTKAAADHPAPDKGSGPRRHKPDKEAR